MRPDLRGREQELAQHKPSWNPEQGLEWAVAQCDLKSKSAQGYDWVDSVTKPAEIMKACMKAYGYERAPFNMGG